MTVETWVLSYLSNTEFSQGRDIHLDDNYIEMGFIDSFGLIVLIEDVETYFSVKFEDEDLTDRNFIIVRGLIEIIQSKLK